MQQAVMTAPGIIEFRNVPVPECAPGQVLVKIRRIGICGSDIHVYHGKQPYTSYPVVQGHEVSGEIERVGTGVKKLKKGDRVTIQPQMVCGRCYACTHGSYHICDQLKVMGFQTTGAASEFFSVAADKIIKLPAGMSFDSGALVEPLAVAVHALRRHGEVTGKKVLVLGAGPIGNLVAQSARGMGAEDVMITDISPYRLELAGRCGIETAIDTASSKLSDALAERFGPDRADLILECVGINETMEQAIACARKGSDIILVGVFAAEAQVDLGLVQDRELRLIGTLMYQEQDYREAIDLMASGRVITEPLVTGHFAFSEYPRAYTHIEEKKDRSMKVMIDLD